MFNVCLCVRKDGHGEWEENQKTAENVYCLRKAGELTAVVTRFHLPFATGTDVFVHRDGQWEWEENQKTGEK